MKHLHLMFLKTSRCFNGVCKARENGNTNSVLYILASLVEYYGDHIVLHLYIPFIKKQVSKTCQTGFIKWFPYISTLKTSAPKCQLPISQYSDLIFSYIFLISCCLSFDMTDQHSARLFPPVAV